MKELIEIQTTLKVNKNQRNNFGKYNYRSCEDILEGVKPLLSKLGCSLTLSDQIREEGSLTFVEATATLKTPDSEHVVTAQAGIDPNRKGMDIAQSFGSSSSYARKYALAGLFLLDDNKDADSHNTGSTPAKKPGKPYIESVAKPFDVEEWKKNMKKHGLWDYLNDEEKDSVDVRPTEDLTKRLKKEAFDRKKEQA